MEYRTLAHSDLRVSAVAFGGGPVSQLLVGDDLVAQRATIAAAIESGVNWFDTAPDMALAGRKRTWGCCSMSWIRNRERIWPPRSGYRAS